MAEAAQSGDLEALRSRARGSNVNPETLLATDYLNHFNEIVMILDLLPSMPECLEDAQEWTPKSYVEHFQASGIADKELAIEAYAHAPTCFKRPFETAIAQMNQIVEEGVTAIAEVIGSGDDGRLEVAVSNVSRSLQKFIDVASSIIHGDSHTMDQDEIDQLLNA